MDRLSSEFRVWRGRGLLGTAPVLRVRNEMSAMLQRLKVMSFGSMVADRFLGLEFGGFCVSVG